MTTLCLTILFYIFAIPIKSSLFMIKFVFKSNLQKKPIKMLLFCLNLSMKALKFVLTNKLDEKA